jgi:NitT/TauT family transport system permease protein
MIAFLIATIGGTIIAIILWRFDYLRKILDPYIVVLNSLPKIALGPIIIVWFGIGTTPIIVMAILIMIVITIISMLNSFTSCDENKVLLLKSMGANKFQILTKLILPNSLLEFISVLKINVGLTWVGTIMGEYLVSKAGLGYLIIYGSQIFNLDLVMASTIILCILAAIMYFIVAFIEKKVNKKYNL